MQIIEQNAQMIFPITENQAIVEMKTIELAGRNCYNSRNKITDTSYDKFIRNLISHGHESPLEFGKLTFDITTSRAVLAEITRHRLASFCCLSQRYVNMDKEGGESGIKFIRPEWCDIDKLNETEAPESVWLKDMLIVEQQYNTMIASGQKSEQAREVLPNSTYCQICMSANVREWRHIFELRCSKAAYPQIRTLMKDMLTLAYRKMPCCFEDLYNKYITEGETINE